MAQINPIIRLDYPDPDVIRVGEVYYMVSTTMHFMPGCEILRSYDLVHWEHTTYVYDRLDSTPGQMLEGQNNIYGKGMWAASLRHHKGVFYICFVANDTGRTYLYHSQDIHGPWKKQYVEGFYHDCSLLFDDDDRVYIAFSNKDIRIMELKSDLSGPKEGGLNRIVVSDTGNNILGYEGSHLYKLDGRYYLFLIHSLKDRWRRVEACFMAESLEGEFTGGDILNDDRGYQNQGVAQGGIVDTPDGRWYAILFQDHGAVGRIPVLMPAKFVDGRSVFGDNGRIEEPFEVPMEHSDYVYRPLIDSDDFRRRDEVSDSSVERKTISEEYDTYGFKSCWQINHEPDLSLIKNDCEKGILEITTGKLCTNCTQAQNVFTQRMYFPKCSGSITVDGSQLLEGDYAGICAFAGCYGMVALTRKNDGYYIVLLERALSLDSTHGAGRETYIETESACVSTDESTVRLMVSADFDNMKDEVTFFYRNGSEWHSIGTSKKMHFAMDHFTGCRFALCVYATKKTGGKALFSDFIYEK